jgi:hypothetical protein
MKKLFLNFVLPVFLLISAVVLIGSGCTGTDDDEDEGGNNDDLETITSMHLVSVYKPWLHV